MNEDSVRKVLAEIGKRGGIARAKALSAKRRKEIATKGSKAALKALRARRKAAKK